jgi:hypothetical protein
LKILLYDVDSVLPNIALMKLSAYHKNKNDQVEIIKGDGKPIKIDYSKYDAGYASVIFTKHKNLIESFPFQIGGTGIDLETELPYEIEHLMPDYSLYPENEYSIGFTTRGCVRNCEFCFVPRKEGLIKYNADIAEFYNPKLKKLMLLDNNIFAYKDYKKVFEQIRAINKPTCFKQGMDFRLLTDDKVNELLSIKYDREFIFAYDSMKIKPVIEKQMNKFRSRFKDWRLKFFVLVGFDTSLKDDVFRINYLKDNKCLPYVMRYQDCYTSEYKDFYTDLAAWCNQVWAFKTMDFETFLNRRYKNEKRIQYSLNLWRENV